MKTIIIAIAMLTACTTDSDPKLDEARELIKHECGDAPQAPGFATSFNGDTATMSRATYEAIAAWRTDVDTYTACVQGYDR